MIIYLTGFGAITAGSVVIFLATWRAALLQPPLLYVCVIYYVLLHRLLSRPVLNLSVKSRPQLLDCICGETAGISTAADVYCGWIALTATQSNIS